jgi:hypothetical protein
VTAWAAAATVMAAAAVMMVAVTISPTDDLPHRLTTEVAAMLTKNL